MKIYSWKTLLITMLVGGLGLAYAFYKIFQRDVWGYGWFLIFLAQIIRGLQVALTEEGYKKDMENARITKKIDKRCFGKFAPVMPYGVLFIFVLAVVSFWMFPEQIGLFICLVLAMPVYQLWRIWFIRREAETEKREQKTCRLKVTRLTDIEEGAEE